MGAFVKKIKLFVTVGLLVYSFNPIHSDNHTALGKTGILTAEEFNIIAEKLFSDKRFAATDFVPSSAVIRLLNRAVGQNDLETVKFLLNKGIDINLTDEGWLMPTPLESAAANGNAAMVKLFLEAGANPNINRWGCYPRLQNDCLFYSGTQTPLHYAAIKNYLEIIKILLDHGADINMQNDEGNTALHFAVGANKPEMVNLLLSAGADRYIRNKQGYTPLDLANKYWYNNYMDSDVMDFEILTSLRKDSWFSSLWNIRR